MWRNSGGREQWWLNLFDGILLERERKKNLRINRAVSMSVVQKDLMCCLLKNNWPWPYTFWRIKAFLRWRCVSTVPLFLCVNCSSGPCCKLFLWSCVPAVSLFLNAYCSFIPECLLFPWSCISTVPPLVCAQRSLSPLCTKSYGSVNLWSCVSTVALFLSAHWGCGPASPPSL